ncbi:hypothetical protein ACFL55_03205, partial [Candidatus Latescibacterota bacterium]
MPNRAPLDVEMKILDYIEHYPSHGPIRIADELRPQGVSVKPYERKRPRLALPHPSGGVIITKV